MRGPHDLGPDLKEPIHELHGLDVGHRGQTPYGENAPRGSRISISSCFPQKEALEAPNTGIRLAQPAGRDHVLISPTAGLEAPRPVPVTLGTMSSSRFALKTRLRPGSPGLADPLDWIPQGTHEVASSQMGREGWTSLAAGMGQAAPS
jgi:hypothetical protein